MKPLPFELPAVICPDGGASARQQENKDADEKNPDDHLCSLFAPSAPDARRGGVISHSVLPELPFAIRFSGFESVYRQKMKELAKEGATFFHIETPGSLLEARAALLAAKKSFSGPAAISFKVDDEGRSNFGSDAMALYVISEAMGAAAFGLCSDGPMDALSEVFARIAPYARIPLMVFGDGAAVLELLKKIPQAGLVLCKKDAGAEAASSLLREMKPPRFLDRDPELILAASGKEAFFVDATIDFLQEVECSSDFPEDILRAEIEGGGLKIPVRTEDDVDLLEQYQYMINQPVCFCSESPALLEAALIAYNGRAFLDGTCGIDGPYLKYLSDFYGLIIL